MCAELYISNNDTYIKIQVTKNNVIITDAKIYIKNLSTPKKIVEIAKETGKLISQNLSVNGIKNFSFKINSQFKNFSKILVDSIILR